MDVGDVWVGEEALDQRCSLRPFGEIGFDHHVVGVEAAERERAAGKCGRDDGARGEAGVGLADEDRALLVIRRVGALVGVVEEDDAFADLGVVERDTARRGWLFGDADAAHAARGELFVAHGVEVGEGRGIEAGDLECHAGNVVQIARVRWPLSDFMLSAMRLNQVTAPASDLDASIAFYQLLGLRLIVKSPHYARFELPKGEATFSLHVVEGAIPRENAPHVYFELSGVGLDTQVERLKAAGVAFERDPVAQSWLWREAWLRDPAGNAICLYHAGENRRFPPWRVDTPPGEENLHLIIRENGRFVIVKSDGGAEAWRVFQDTYADFKTSLGPYDLHGLLSIMEIEWPEEVGARHDRIRAFVESDESAYEF